MENSDDMIQKAIQMTMEKLGTFSSDILPLKLTMTAITMKWLQQMTQNTAIIAAGWLYCAFKFTEDYSWVGETFTPDIEKILAVANNERGAAPGDFWQSVRPNEGARLIRLASLEGNLEMIRNHGLREKKRTVNDWLSARNYLMGLTDTYDENLGITEQEKLYNANAKKVKIAALQDKVEHYTQRHKKSDAKLDEEREKFRALEKPNQEEMEKSEYFFWMQDEMMVSRVLEGIKKKLAELENADEDEPIFDSLGEGGTIVDLSSLSSK